MPSSKELRERRGVLNRQFQEIVSKCEAENRDCTLTEEATLKEINEEDTALVNRIQRLEEADARNEDLSRAIDIAGRQRGLPTGSEHAVTDADFALGAMILSNSGRNVSDQDWDRAERGGYRPGLDSMTLHLPTCRPTPGNEVLFSPRNDMHTKVPSKGGAWVMPSSSGRFETALKQFGPMVVVGEVIVTSGGEPMKWPMFDDTASSAVLIAENQQAPGTDLITKAQLFSAHKGTTGVLRVPNEALSDSIVDVSGEVQTAFGARMGRLQNHLFTLGDTPDAPRGIVPSATVGKQTASSTAIVADELIDLISSVDPAYASQPGAGWMMHPEVFAAISKLRDNQGNFLSGNLEGGVTPRLRGYPVALNSDMSNSFTAGERIALFGDLRAYKIRYVGQQRIFRMVEKFADYDQTGFVMFWRFDGGLLDAGTHPVKCLQMKP